MALTASARSQPAARPWVAPLALAGMLFAALVATGLTIVWILDAGAEPGAGLVVVPLLALFVLGASTVPERTIARRPGGRTELGDTTRMVAMVGLLLTVPAFLLHGVVEDGPQTEVLAGTVGEARGIAAACPAAEVERGTFDDVIAGTSHGEAVECLAWWGVAGSDGARFHPQGPVSREQMATFLARLVPAAGGALPRLAPDGFADDRASAHEANINRVADAGIMGGRADGSFGPGAPVTRAQMASLLARAYERVAGERLPVAPQDAFHDDDNSVHERWINRAATAGFVAGSADGTYGPDTPVTRGQAATMIARFLDKAVADGLTDPPTA